MANFKTDLKKSIAATKNFINPALKKIFGIGAEILSVENEDSAVARTFDSAGIDSIVKVGGAVIGVNSRCHKNRCKKTFTIRETRHGNPAEYARIVSGMKNGGIYPKFFAQCYVNDDGDCATVGVIETKNLFDYIGKYYVPRFQNGDVEFFSVGWRDLHDMKIPMAVFSVDKTGIKKIV